MAEITIKKVCETLLDLDICTEQELQDLSEKQIRGLSFKNDLAVGSLDYILFIEKLNNEHSLTVLENAVWECHTIGDLLTLYNK